MFTAFKPLREQVMVITGASSGIGLATAYAAAKAGARLVLASRNGQALAEIVHNIRSHGGEAMHVVTDVGRRAEVQRLAEVAEQRFGGFDTWVNNAGLSIWGRLDQVSDEDHHRLFETNFWGMVYGSLIAAEYLKRRGGTLINLGSIVSDVAVPLQGMYSASKHAIKGFTNAFRIELEEAGAPLSVTLIKPSAINTPFPHHAKNYTDREPKLPPPVYEPEEVAHAILYAATHAEREITVGGGGKMMALFGEHAKQTYDWLARKMVGQQLRNEPPRNPAGALYAAGEDGDVRGDHPGYVMKTSLYTRSALHPLLTGALLTGAGLAFLTWYNSRRPSDRVATRQRPLPQQMPHLPVNAGRHPAGVGF